MRPAAPSPGRSPARRGRPAFTMPMRSPRNSTSSGAATPRPVTRGRRRRTGSQRRPLARGQARAATLNLSPQHARKPTPIACGKRSPRSRTSTHRGRQSSSPTRPRRRARRPGWTFASSCWSRKRRAAARLSSSNGHRRCQHEDERQLASIASPLLVPDLPDFLWWAAHRPGGRSSRTWSASATASSSTAPSLSTPRAPCRRCSISPAPSDHAALGDLAWARLSPWRRLTTQFFDVAATLAILNQIDEATLTYANSPNRWSGFSGALLFAGWLGSRLNWRTPGELLPVRGDPNAWRATLRAGTAGNSAR